MELVAQVRTVLWEVWDPIGVNDCPDTHGEYASYAPPLAALLRSGAPAAEIERYLAEIVHGRMRLLPINPERVRRTIEALRAIPITPRTMHTEPWVLRRLHAPGDAEIEQLVDVLADCVESGASVSFMHPLTRERAEEFWRHVARETAAGERALLVAEDADGLCGTVQLVLAQPENQPHRADLAKMLVHRRARRRGLGAALMQAAEATARECGKTLLVLDTVTGSDASRLYERLGWVRVGEIPGYALFPDGRPCGTTLYYRDLR